MVFFAGILWVALPGVRGQEHEGSSGTPTTGGKEAVFTGLSLRGIGPAVMSGRVSDIAVDP